MGSRGHTRTKGGPQGPGMVLLLGLVKQGACRVEELVVYVDSITPVERAIRKRGTHREREGGMGEIVYSTRDSTQKPLGLFVPAHARSAVTRKHCPPHSCTDHLSFFFCGKIKNYIL